MYVIRGKFKNVDNKRTWLVSGLDSRPLMFTEYGVAHRECEFFQRQNIDHVRDYGDEEVIYEVISQGIQDRS